MTVAARKHFELVGIDTLREERILVPQRPHVAIVIMAQGETQSFGEIRSLSGEEQDGQCGQ
jgi:hypothetical protein